MFDTMTMTKVVGAGCGSLLVFLLGSWVSDIIYSENSNAEQAYLIETGASEGAGAAADEGPSFAELLVAADPAAGEKVWGKCRACHKLDGTDGTGPHLNGVVGRSIGSSEGFAYSNGMAGMNSDFWTPENLQAFLLNPKGFVPGTKMSFAGLPKVQERANLIAYLQTQK